MNNIYHSLIGLCVTVSSLTAIAQTADEHKEHHPAGATPPVATTPKGPAKSTNIDMMATMDQHIKAMQTMHKKMASAKSPEERQALMVENRKLMQDGMSMLQQMGTMTSMGGMQSGKGLKGNMADRHQMMEKRMNMMESMLQMMLDRMPTDQTN